MGFGLRAARASCIGLAAAIELASSATFADGDPNIDWWTVHTAHFNVHYPKDAEPVATKIATLAENVHGRLKDSLGYVPKSKTEIVLTDDVDIANGSATALPYNTIRLYMTAPDDISPLNDYDDWYLELVTHEYTHILHTDNISGVPAIINAVIGKTYAPNQAQPRWILEGLAVVEESQHSSGGRLRSSIWDMYLRADVIDHNIATLDQVSSGAYRWPQGNIWYLYGSRFLRWIIDVYGPDTMREVSADYGSHLAPWDLNRTIRRATGRTYEQLYEGFKDYIKRGYGDQIAAVEKRGLREGRRITWRGRTVAYPRFTPKSAREKPGEIVYYRDDQDARSGLYRIALGDKSAPELVARTDGVSNAAWTPNGDLVFNSTTPFRNVYQRNDLFRVPKGERATSAEEGYRKQITEGLRTLGPDLSPDGKHVVFTVNTKGTTYLEIADVDADGEIVNRRDLVPSLRWEQAYTPRFSHDGRKVAYSVWSEGGYRDVRIVDVATGKFEQITKDRAIDVDPVFSPDDARVYFSSDRSGVPNIYEYTIATGRLMQVTNVRTGAFMPAVSDDEKTLVYTGYTTEGFDLFAMPIDRSLFLDAASAPRDRPDAPETRPVEMTLARYNAFPTILPHHYTADLKPSPYGDTQVDVMVQASDAVGLHAITGTFTGDPKAPGPEFAVEYDYGRLPVDLSIRFFDTVIPRSGYRVDNVNLGYDEVNTGITTGLSYTKRDEFAQHSFGLSFSAAHFRGDLPSARFLDPNTSVTTLPPQGNLDILHLGYGYSNVESSLETSGAPRGVALGIGLDYGSPFIGSQYTVRSIQGSFATYLEMPWRGHHTLALRTTGAAASGQYPRGASYSVGGYDLMNNSLPSTVLSGVFNGSFVLRGYPAGAYAGSEYVLQNIEYRVPVYIVDHGYSTLPVYLRRLDANFFLDYGGAFNNLDVKNISFFRNGALLDAPQLHTAMGLELWSSFVLGYGLTTQFRLGYAHGFSEAALREFLGGQLYFVASAAY